MRNKLPQATKGVSVIKIPHLFKELKSGRIKRGLKNFSYLTAGTIISQIIGFIGFIYLARYLGPEYYGIYVTVGAFMGMFELLSFKGLKKVVIRECSKDVENADKILNKTVGLQSLFIFLAILAMLIGSLFSGYETRTILFIAIFSLKLFSKRFRSYISSIYMYSEKMKYVPIFSIVQRILFVGLVITFLTLGFGLFSVVMISVFSSLFNLLLQIYHSRRITKFNLFSKLHLDLEIIKPSLVFSAIRVVGRLYSRVDLFMISLLGTPVEVAIYGVAHQLAREGQLIKNKIAEAFFPIAIKVLDRGSVRKKTIFKYSILFLMGMLGLAIIGYFLAEPVVRLFFGEEYIESAPILRVLIFFMVAWFSTLPFSEAIQATGNEKVLLLGKGVMACINIPLNIILYFTYGLIGIAYSTLVVYTVGSILIIVYSYYRLNKQGYFK